MDVSNRLLLVEDNPDIREVFSLVLKSFGYEVIACSDGLSAIHKATERLPDVAIIDVGLPDIEGDEVASIIRKLECDRKESSRCILVAVTGHDTIDPSMQAGFDLQFTKPIELQTIHSEIQAVLSERSRVGVA